MEIGKELLGKLISCKSSKIKLFAKNCKKTTKHAAQISPLSYGGLITGLVMQQLPLPNNGGLMQGCQFGIFEAKFWNSGFFDALGIFWKSKILVKIWLFFYYFFQSERLGWPWQNIVWAAYSLQISSDGSLWPYRVQRILQRFYCCPKNLMYLIRNNCMTVYLWGKKMLLTLELHFLDVSDEF